MVGCGMASKNGMASVAWLLVQNMAGKEPLSRHARQPQDLERGHSGILTIISCILKVHKFFKQCGGKMAGSIGAVPLEMAGSVGLFQK